jgi:hypothetical protein
MLSLCFSFFHNPKDNEVRKDHLDYRNFLPRVNRHHWGQKAEIQCRLKLSRKHLHVEWRMLLTRESSKNIQFSRIMDLLSMFGMFSILNSRE